MLITTPIGSDLARSTLDSFNNLASPVNWWSTLIYVTVLIILVLLLVFPVILRTVFLSWRTLQTHLTELKLKKKNGGNGTSSSTQAAWQGLSRKRITSRKESYWEKIWHIWGVLFPLVMTETLICTYTEAIAVTTL